MASVKVKAGYLHKEDSVDTLLHLSTQQLNVDPGNAFNLAMKAKEIALQYPSKSNTPRALWLMGKAKIELEDYQHAIKYLSEAWSTNKPSKDEFLSAEIAYELALAYYYNGRYQESIEKYRYALKIYKKLNKIQDIANTLQNIGLVHHSLEDINKAKEYYQQSLDINIKLKNDTNIAGLYQNLGIISYRNDELKEALDFYEKSISIFNNIGDTSGIASTFSNIGLIHLRQGDCNAAYKSFKNSYKIFVKINFKNGQLWALHNMGSALLNNNDYTGAKKYFLQSLKIAEETNFPEGVIANYENLSDLYSKMHDYEQALKYYSCYTQMYDSIQSAETKHKIAELELLYNLEQKERLLNESIADLKRQKTKNISIVFVLCILLAASVFVFIAYKQKKKVELKLELHRENLENIIIEKSRELKNEITERKIAEESDKLKSAFLANMSHELRTPMNAIIAFTNFLHDPELSGDKKTEFLEHINIASETLLHLIDDIMDIAKLESKQMKMHISPTNISRLIKDIYNVFIELQKKNKYTSEFVLQLNNEYDLIINTDSLRLKQILSNLIDNAFKYTKEGIIEFGLTELPDKLEFYIKDNGIGIPKDKQEKIFERFLQLEYSLDRKFGGTGLGLAISKNLTELLGGTIRVNSEPGKGSIFFVTIPAKDLRKVSISKEHHTIWPILKSKDFNWESKTILIAEDEELNYKVLDTCLSKTRARIIRACDGETAVRIFKQEKIDLVLMDIQMPFMDGYKATAEIKKINNNTPVIAQTSFVMANEMEKCISAGCDDYISKPLNLNDLLIKINRYMC